MNSPLNPHIAARLKDKADKIKASHSAYWMGSDASELVTKVQEGSAEFLDRLRTIQRSVAGFVRIATGRNIPVMFSSGNQSYTDGKVVVISADTDPAALDSIVGVALHESSHCVKSNEALRFLPKMAVHFSGMIADRQQLLADATRLNIDVQETPTTTPPPYPGNSSPSVGMKVGKNGSVRELVQMVMNVLEDRRIDLWMYRQAPGYRAYYDAMYDEHWHSHHIDMALQQPEYRTPNVENYVLHVINMTNKHFDGTAMPGLTEIRQIANITESGLAARGDEDPGWKKSNILPLVNGPKLFEDAVKIVELMLKHSTRYDNPNAQKKKSKGEGMDGTELPNLDPGKVREAVAGQRKFLDHNTGKKAVSLPVHQRLIQLDQTNAHIEPVDGDFIEKNVKANVVVYRDVTLAAVKSHNFPLGNHGVVNPSAQRALQAGLQMGRSLTNRIAVMQDERPLTFTRQQSGRLDKRLIAGLGFGQESVFSHTFIERREPADIWIDVDLSGSMVGAKFERAMAVAVAIAYAADKTRTLNCTVAVRTADGDDAHLAILYDSNRHSFNHLRHIVPYVKASGGTPEGLCFAATKNEILAKGRKQGTKYFVNLSDGEPYHTFQFKGKSYSYSGSPAWEHTRKIMNEFRLEGIKVLSYFITGSDADRTSGFRTMYGKDAAFVDASQVTGIVKQLNKLLMHE